MTTDLIDLSTITLSHGAHATYGKGVCALELADYLDRRRRGVKVTSRTKLNDSPDCVCPVIAAFCRRWNDGFPSTPKGDAERTRILGPLVPRLLGTRATTEIERRRTWLAVDWYVRECTPAWLDLAGFTEHATALRDAAPITGLVALESAQPALERVLEAARAANPTWSATWGAAWSEPWRGASSAASSAAWSAAGCGAVNTEYCAAASAAAIAAWNAAASGAWNTAASALRPTVEALQVSAVRLVERMIDCGDVAS